MFPLKPPFIWDFPVSWDHYCRIFFCGVFDAWSSTDRQLRLPRGAPTARGVLRLYCLVVYLPLWTILVSGDDYPRYMRKSNMFQTTNWIIYNDVQSMVFDIQEENQYGLGGLQVQHAHMLWSQSMTLLSQVSATHRSEKIQSNLPFRCSSTCAYRLCRLWGRW